MSLLKLKLSIIMSALTMSTLLLAPLNTNASSDNAKAKESLVQIIHALHAIKPLVHEFEINQTKNPRIKIHVNHWQDNQGRTHSGLKDDLDAIEQSLIAALNKTEVTPRYVAPIEGDYVS